MKEQCRDSWRFDRLESIRQDARIALRALRNAPALAAVSVLSLALGSARNAADLQPGQRGPPAAAALPGGGAARPPERLLPQGRPGGAAGAVPHDGRRGGHGGHRIQPDRPGSGRAPRRQRRFREPLHAARPRRGARPHVRAGRRPAGPRRRRRARATALAGAGSGATLPSSVVRSTLEGVDRRVVGRDAGRLRVSLRVRGAVDPAAHRSQPDGGLLGLRLDAARSHGSARVSTLAQADGDLQAQVPRIARLFPWPRPTGTRTRPSSPCMRTSCATCGRKLLVLQAAVALVLLIACANVASLLLARVPSPARRRWRSGGFLGAGRGRLLRQLLTESVTLALVGGVLGLASPGSPSPARPRSSRARSGSGTCGSTGEVLAAASALTLLCGMLFGTVPALAASRVRPGCGHEGGRVAGYRARRPRACAARSSRREVALAVVLAVGAGLLVRTLWRLTQVDPGFRPRSDRHRCASRRTLRLRRARGLPRPVRRPAPARAPGAGRNGRGAASVAPLARRPAAAAGRARGPPAGTRPMPKATLLWAGAVTRSYFEVMRIPLLRGRGFEDADGPNAAPVVVVSAATALRFWPDEDPIGKTHSGGLGRRAGGPWSASSATCASTRSRAARRRTSRARCTCRTRSPWGSTGRSRVR